MAVEHNPEECSGCFDCNICLEIVSDPVVTLCGHLYCWPCIYKWCKSQIASVDSKEHQECPVCKSGISVKTMVPLYGPGQTPEPKHKNKRKVVPPRPPAPTYRIEDPFGTEQQLAPYCPVLYQYATQTYQRIKRSEVGKLVIAFGSLVFSLCTQILGTYFQLHGNKYFKTYIQMLPVLWLLWCVTGRQRSKLSHLIVFILLYAVGAQSIVFSDFTAVHALVGSVASLTFLIL